ncbi:hypothetical protein ACYOEI_25445, partial [Singulisphaera rosea]
RLQEMFARSPPPHVDEAVGPTVGLRRFIDLAARFDAKMLVSSEEKLVQEGQPGANVGGEPSAGMRSGGFLRPLAEVPGPHAAA